MDKGELVAAGAGWQLVFTRHLAHPVGKVWRAITEPAHLAAWFPTEIHGERAEGAPLRFTFPGGEDDAVFDGEVRIWDPPRTFAFRWGEDEFRMDLAPTPNGTVLTLTHSFDEKGRAVRDAAGWHACLDLLDAALDGVEPDFDPKERWEKVHPMYVEAFGEDAATVGPPGP